MTEERLDGFVRELRQAEIPLHSVAVLDHGEVAGERYLAPFGKDTLQRMYSVTKSFVSVAVGFLIQDGKLGLHDPILEYFKEYDTPAVSEQIRRLRIEDMLKMQTCYLQTTYKTNPGGMWVPSFFAAAPHHEPGMIFMYDTSSTDTLCALVEKLSGKELLAFLRERCLDEIGFSREAYVMRNRFGEAMGGSGLMAKTGDMVKFARLLMDDGKHHGNQLLPPDYMREATSLQAATRISTETQEERQGYGYQFWRLTHNGFGCYGKGGQLILCYPDYETAVVTTADTTGVQGGNQAIYGAVYRHLLPEPRYERNHSFGSGGASADGRPGGKYFCLGECHWKWISFEADRIVFGTETEHCALHIGWDAAVDGDFPLYGGRCRARAWQADRRSIFVRAECLGENMACFELQAAFRDGRMTCRMKHTQDFGYEEFSGWIEGRAASDKEVLWQG